MAAETVRVAKEGTKANLSDLFTKLLPQPRREELLDKFTYLWSKYCDPSHHFEGTEQILRYGILSGYPFIR